jgi:hypothetical protein
MISVLPLSTSHIHVATSHYHLHTGYISLNWFDMQGPALYTISFLSRGRQLTDKLMLQGFLQSSLRSEFRKFYDLIYNYKLSLSHLLSDIFHTNIFTTLGTLTLTADNPAFMIMELGSRRVWSMNRGYLLLLGTWSHLRYIWGSVLALLFLWFVIPACVLRLITLWYLSHFIWL